MLTAWLAWILAGEMRERAAYSGARAYAAVLEATRDRYMADVLTPLREARAAGAIPHTLQSDLPLAYELLRRVGTDVALDGDVRFRIVSNYPWPGIEAASPSDLELLQRVLSLGGGEIVEQRDEAAGRRLVYAEPIEMKQACADCHNSHPASPKRGWKEGDIRGAQIVEVGLVPIPLWPGDESLQSVALLVAPAFVVLFFGGFWILRLQRADAKRAHSERLAALVESTGDAMISLDRHGRVATFNRAAESLLGYEEEEVLGIDPSLFMLPEDRDRHRDGFRAFLQRGGSVHADPAPVEVMAVPKSGDPIPVGMVASMIQGDGTARVLASIRDLRATKELDDHVRRTEKLEALGHLTAGVAHDFNNLLTVILGNSELLLTLETNEQVRAASQDIRRAAEYGARLTQDLLAFARRQALNPVSLQLAEFLTPMVGRLERTLGEWLQVSVLIPEDAWPIWVDVSRLETAILNLAVNARDSMLPAGGSLRIEVENRTVSGSEHAELEPGDYVVLRVQDFGAGMSAKVLDRIFEPFFTTKDRGTGTGLGLSAVQGLTRQSGGDVVVRSKEGVGTTVELFFPRSTSAAPQTEKQRRSPLANRMLRAVVAEDDAAVRSVIVRMLDRLDIQCVEASNADEAMGLLEGISPPDLLISDVSMPPGRSGLELAKDARALHPALGVVLMSGFATAEVDARARSLDVRFVPKPVVSAAIEQAISESLESARPSHS